MEEVINAVQDTNDTKVRYYSLDFLKFFCAFFVVCLHVPFPGIWGNVFNSAVCRIAIPIFFMITGFFYTNTKDKERESKQIIKIIWYILVATAISFVTRIAVNLYKGTIVDYFKSFLSWRVWLNLLLFNESPFGAHIWYLNAILYVLLIIFLIEKLFDRKYLYFLIPALLVGCLLLGSYSLPLFGVELDTYIYRNFLFVGLPFFLLGDLIYRYKNRFNLNKLLIQIIIAVFLLLSITGGFFEAYYLRYYFSYDLYLCTISSSTLIFLLFLTIDNSVFKNNKLMMRISSLGKNNSQLVYIFQILFITIFSFISQILSLVIFDFFAPTLVFILSLLFSITIRFFNRNNNFFYYLHR